MKLQQPIPNKQKNRVFYTNLELLQYKIDRGEVVKDDILNCSERSVRLLGADGVQRLANTFNKKRSRPATMGGNRVTIRLSNAGYNALEEASISLGQSKSELVEKLVRDRFYS